VDQGGDAGIYIALLVDGKKIGSSAAQKRLFFNLRKLKAKIGADGGISERGLSDAQVATSPVSSMSAPATWLIWIAACPGTMSISIAWYRPTATTKKSIFLSRPRRTRRCA